jgi:hypothetical protein
MPPIPEVSSEANNGAQGDYKQHYLEYQNPDEQQDIRNEQQDFRHYPFVFTGIVVQLVQGPETLFGQPYQQHECCDSQQSEDDDYRAAHCGFQFRFSN